MPRLGVRVHLLRYRQSSDPDLARVGGAWGVRSADACGVGRARGSCVVLVGPLSYHCPVSTSSSDESSIFTVHAHAAQWGRHNHNRSTLSHRVGLHSIQRYSIVQQGDPLPPISSCTRHDGFQTSHPTLLRVWRRSRLDSRCMRVQVIQAAVCSEVRCDCVMRMVHSRCSSPLIDCYAAGLLCGVC